MPLQRMDFPLLPSPLQGALTDALKGFINSKYEIPVKMSTILYKNAMAKYLNSPGKMEQGLTPLGKTFIEQKLFGGGQSGMQGGSAEGDQDNSSSPYQAYQQKIAYDPVVSRNAQSAQLIHNQINDIDTKPLEEFSGAGGRVKLWKERGKGALSSLGVPVEPSQEFRDYNSYMAVNKNAIMDAIRSALKTSVVPEYVMKTLAPMVDPSSPVWNDPQQVRQNVQTLKDWIRPYAAEQTAAMRQGVAPTLEESERRHKSLSKKLSSSKEAQQEGMAQVGRIKRYNPATGRIE